MKFQRREKSKNPIDIYGVRTVDTGAMFKQYDMNTSILELELVVDGEPVHLTNEDIYLTVKSSTEINTDELKVRARKINDNLLEIYLSEDILKNAGDMIAEILIVDVEGEQRLTSESFTFKIEPSLTPNMKNLNFEKAFEKGDDE